MNLENAAITTSKPREHLIEIAKLISEDINIPYIPKDKVSINKFKKLNDIDDLLIVREDRIQVTSNDNEFFFHPGLSIPRVKHLKKCSYDTMVHAMDLQPGDSVLDCTLGLANDAIVASFIVKEEGKVVGLESSPFIYTITKWGLQKYDRGSKDTRKAMKDITVYNKNYESYLKELPPDSFDVVYFDPMFEKPLYKSSGICNLRNFANYEQLNKDIINLALKVAKKRVVFKDRSDSDNFLKLNADTIIGGKYSNIAYGVFFS